MEVWFVIGTEKKNRFSVLSDATVDMTFHPDLMTMRNVLFPQDSNGHSEDITKKLLFQDAYVILFVTLTVNNEQKNYNINFRQNNYAIKTPKH